jgi:hypothetical protein
MSTEDRDILLLKEWLCSRGYHVQSEVYSPEFFGNRFIELSNGLIRIDLLSDRGQVFVDIGLVGDRSLRGLRFILMELGVEVKDLALTGESAMKFLEKYYSDVTRHLARSKSR